MRGVFHKLTSLTTPSTSKEKLGVGEGIFEKEWFLFFLILVLFPANLAKHIELPSAYIQGVLVDYLLPKLYLIEILILSLLLLAIIKSVIMKKYPVRNLLPLLFLLPFFISFGEDVFVSFSRLVELILWGGFALWIMRNIRWERDQRLLTKALSLGVSWVSLLALAQFLRQGNVFGYYFLGEPIIYPSLGGVAKASFFGREVMRAYGTFSHPNALGGAAALITPWLLAQGYFLPAGLALIGLFVSFSRLAWACFFLGLFALVILKTKSFRRSGTVVLLLAALLTVLVCLSPSSTGLSVTRRVELFQSAWAMIRTSPLFGVGLGLFTAELPSFGLPSGPTLFLQPVHNIFALVAAESGLLALFIFLFIFVLAVRETWRRQRLLLLGSLGQLFLLGLFDHYLYTSPQGLFLLSLTLGLVFSYAEVDGRRPAYPQSRDAARGTNSSGED